MRRESVAFWGSIRFHPILGGFGKFSVVGFLILWGNLGGELLFWPKHNLSHGNCGSHVGSELRERAFCSVTKGSLYTWTKSRDHGSLRVLENDM